MARLIDADALEKELNNERERFVALDMKGAEHILVHSALRLLREAPTVDAVPVVRCEDCKYGDWYTVMNRKRLCYCTEHGSSGHNENDYCSYGERKDNDIREDWEKTMTDYIKREDAYRRLTEYYHHTRDTQHESLRIALIGIPSADVAPVRHGRWVDKGTITDEKAEVITEWQSARCTYCNKYHTTPYLYYFDNFTYCPNCGARMDGGED